MRFIVSSVYLFFMMGMVNSFADETIEIKNLSVPLRFAGGALIAAAAVGIFSVILVPYRAQRAVARTPDFFDLKVLEPVKTIADLESLARQYPDQSLVFEKLGWVYAKEKKWQPAIASYEQAARLNPGAAGPLNNLGNIYFLLNDRPRAIEYWQRSLALNPRQADSRLNLALAYYYQGRLKACGEQLREVLKIDPANEKAIVLLKQMAE
jgi:tetratricopeptide (TPR) repeat protein